LSPGCPSGNRLSPARVPWWSTVLLLTASPRRLGFDNSWLSSIVRSPRPCLSTDAPCTFPPTRFSISGRSMWRSTWHFVCDEVAISDARVLHVPTTSQFADIFTRVCPRLSWSLLVPAGGGGVILVRYFFCWPNSAAPVA
jgi:hypothetical protein